jgi:pimeloyl-ACP methyl ester carboxylesterase
VCVLLLTPAPGESQSEATTLRSYDGRSMPAEQVRISVPERRAHPGRSISIAALRLRSTAARPGRPIVFLMGGPGIPGSVMAPIPPYFTLFQRLREIGDVIPDQRGIGRSEPGLDCPVTSAPPEDALVDGSALMAASRRQVAACAAQWRAKGDDPTAYNTIESADDIDDLRRALDYDKIDLLAFSYGTRLALAVVARHEAHVGRMVLQGVNGPGQVVKAPVAVARKLQRIGEMLAKDPDWKGSADLLGQNILD